MLLGSALRAERRGRLVDLLVAGGLLGGAQLDRGTNLLELDVAVPVEVAEEAVVEVAYEVAVVYNPYGVLGVAGVGHPLRTHGLVGVGTTISDRERLVYLPALGLLLGLLDYPILKSRWLCQNPCAALSKRVETLQKTRGAAGLGFELD